MKNWKATYIKVSINRIYFIAPFRRMQCFNAQRQPELIVDIVNKFDAPQKALHCHNFQASAF